MAERCVETPMGPVTLTEDRGRITRVQWRFGRRDATPVLEQAESELHEYLAGRRRVFTVPVEVTTSDFQRAVCAAMSAIPYGRTVTYGELARQLNVPAQAVGQGCGANPVPILVPCHRVVGRTGLGGFSGGIGAETKAWLLAHEGALLL